MLESEPSSFIAKLAFEKIFSLIIEDVKKHISNLNTIDYNIIIKLFEKLLDFIPPCENEGKPQPIENILNAGWGVFYYYMNLNSEKKHNDQNEKLRSLNLLCLKAISQSVFLRKFKEK